MRSTDQSWKYSNKNLISFEIINQIIFSSTWSSFYFFGTCISRTVSVFPEPALLPWTRTTRLPGLMMSSCSPNFTANSNRFSTSFSHGKALESVKSHEHNLWKNFISSRLHEPSSSARALYSVGLQVSRTHRRVAHYFDQSSLECHSQGHPYP